MVTYCTLFAEFPYALLHELFVMKVNGIAQIMHFTGIKLRVKFY